MDTSFEYNRLKEKLKEKGAFISNKIVRIHKNGYYGLYTTKKIKMCANHQALLGFIRPFNLNELIMFFNISIL